MAQTLEGMKGKGGSIKLGTTGTISSLMTRELDHISSVPHKQQVSSRSKPQTLPVSVPCRSSSSSSSTSTTPKRLQPRKSSDESSSSIGNSKNTNHRSHGMSQKTKASGRNTTHRVPMLGSADNFSVDRTPVREKNDKKKPNIVEVVDIKCGNAEKAWATPLTSRLKKLGFSKLSESII